MSPVYDVVDYFQLMEYTIRFHFLEGVQRREAQDKLLVQINFFAFETKSELREIEVGRSFL